MVTPLRDGMNLVAKEFVASQGDDPGVLVLSKFSGAASTMREALLVNPYDIDGTAEATFQALRMPLLERRRRWTALMEGVSKHTARSWSASFQHDLEGATAGLEALAAGGHRPAR
jgi:trehalose 6-phosphate synthase